MADDDCWYVVHTHPRQEDRAESNFRLWGLETFLPRSRDRRLNPFSGDVSYVVRPLFPRYIFVRFRLGAVYHRIRFTRGVHSLVSFGGSPCPVGDEIVNLIRLQVGADGVAKTGTEFRAGDRVIVREGPLRRLSGIFEGEMTSAERVAILLDSVSFQARVVVERHTLEKLC
jgi:transcription elongation factor/antiterminator RfaH